MFKKITASLAITTLTFSPASPSYAVSLTELGLIGLSGSIRHKIHR